MKIIPAIDILDGRCVRLVKGKYESAHRVAEDAVKTALGFVADGAELIHLVDLNGAKSGKTDNFELISEITRAAGVPCEVGGGIRDMARAEEYFKAGVARVIIGSAAVTDSGFLKDAISTYGERIAVGLDAANGIVKTDGWLVESGINYIDFAKRLEAIGVKSIIFTDIDRDGTLTGPNLSSLTLLANSVSCDITASGGVSCLDDIKALTALGIYAAICGKALYSGKLSLAEAISAGRA